MSEENKKENPSDQLPFDNEEVQNDAEVTGETLKYNEEQDSFELDADAGGDDTEYDHPLPYDTAAPEGQEDGSLYDEANPYAQSEYQDSQSELDGKLEELDRIVTDSDIQVDELDEKLSEQPEDASNNLDAEGYPKKDDADGDDNPITHQNH
ncbi:hypothetical protein M8998_03330 [Sphingobacterium sp. lm-10]|uniref:hypothetical protein n=1 Tax=Sphingobacterium sp. lm-10 TaxID=2944904 RepID=UPI002021BA3F|nr:hypothetical protein [Sphingobacterium sp. lm-10]MCL7986969.1 hypothetical protein [Sphingobacterium sp. lm-10]